MILTVTASPYLKWTNSVEAPLSLGNSNSMEQVSTVAGGFGTGVAHTLYLGGQDTMAVFPVPEISHYLRLVQVSGLPNKIIPVAGPVPMHLTITDPEGTQTEFRNPPMPLDVSQLAMLRDLIVRLSEDATWVLLAGDLPTIAPAAWYVDVIRALSLYHPNVQIAVATSGQPLRAVVRQLSATQPDVLVVSASELEAVTTTSEISLTAAAEGGDYAALIAAARSLTDRGVREVLVQVSRHVSVLVSEDEAGAATYTADPGVQGLTWQETEVAGYLAAASREDDFRARLSHAVAYANASGGEWDDRIPTPDRVDATKVSWAHVG